MSFDPGSALTVYLPQKGETINVTEFNNSESSDFYLINDCDAPRYYLFNSTIDAYIVRGSEDMAAPNSSDFMLPAGQVIMFMIAPGEGVRALAVSTTGFTGRIRVSSTGV